LTVYFQIGFLQFLSLHEPLILTPVRFKNAL
jgi:hypothetical protein